MPAPHEIVAFPLTVYVAPTGTAFPAINAAPAGAWFLLGTSGARNYDEAGVNVTESQTVETFTGASSTAPRKAFRTAEGLVLGFTLVDLTPEQYAKVLDDVAVTNVVGPPGHKAFAQLRGVDVKTYALLARGESSVDNALNMQFEWPTVFQSGDPAPAFSKGAPAGLAVEFTALEVVANAFGTVRTQTTT